MAVPRVALGLFVYNGERYLAAAIDSLLAQTMADFVLDISDNASTDATEEICRSYGSLDPRIRYVRHSENRGAAWNCNFVAQASPETEFFRWCAHDDIVDPIYLQECMDLLDVERELVCSHSRTRYINSEGDELLRSFRRQQFGDRRPWVRFDQILRQNHDFTYAFALIRRSAMNRIRPYQPVFLGDGIMLAELAFQGPFGEVADHLFANRMHGNRSTVTTASGRGQKAWAEWFGSSQSFPLWRTMSEFRTSIADAPMDQRSKAHCYGVLGRWMLDRWKGLGWELAAQSARVIHRPPEPSGQ